MILQYLGIIAGLVLLVLGADRFVTGAASTARLLGIPTLIIGMTVVGLGTSFPEILVGAVAALDGKTEIAIGNAIGSNIANVGLVLGLPVIFMPLVIRSRTLRREYLLMFFAALTTFLLMLDRELTRIDCVILIIALAGFTIWIVRLARQSPESDALVGEFEKELAQKKSLGTSLLYLTAGLLVLLAGAELLVRCAVVIAQYFGISDLVIGLTVIAIGTSLPELAASFMSIIKKEADIAIGNVIGSNMFNMLAVISVAGIIQPSKISIDVVFRDFPVMFAMTLLMGWMVFIHGSGRFDRIEGLTLFLCFISYQLWLFFGVGIH